jgi:antitoxin ParD1/3/4
MTTITISLPDSLKKFVDAQLSNKGYGNVSEYFRSLLRDAQVKEQDERLQALLLEGLASDRIPLTKEFWTDFKAEAAQLLATHQSAKKSV